MRNGFNKVFIEFTMCMQPQVKLTRGWFSETRLGRKAWFRKMSFELMVNE